MTFHIAAYLCAVIALFTDQNLVIASGVRVNKGALVDQGLYSCFQRHFWVNHAVNGVKIC